MENQEISEPAGTIASVTFACSTEAGLYWGNV